MKKIFYFLTLSVLISNLSFAQCVPNNSLTTSGFYPASLPDAVAGQSYNQVVQFKIPSDTTIMTYTVAISSAQLVSITGLPNGFNYSCSVQNCTYAGGAVGCITITGNPTNSLINSYSLTANLSLSGTVPNFGTQSINVPVPLTLNVVTNNGVAVNQAPAFSYVKKENEILFNNLSNGKLNVRIYDMLGSEVRNVSYQIVKGESTSISTANLETGIYIVTFQLNGKQETFKISKGLY